MRFRRVKNITHGDEKTQHKHRWQTPLCPPCSNVLDFDDLLSLMVALLLDGELTTR